MPASSPPAPHCILGAFPAFFLGTSAGGLEPGPRWAECNRWLVPELSPVTGLQLGAGPAPAHMGMVEEG